MHSCTSKTYKFCIVPKCGNNTENSPNKVYLTVPRGNVNLRRRWLEVMGRGDRRSQPSLKSSVFCCEDHFNLENDMANFMEYKIMGSVKRYRLKPDCVPSKFDCQSDHHERASPATHEWVSPAAHRKQKPLTAIETARQGGALSAVQNRPPGSIFLLVPVVVLSQEQLSGDFPERSRETHTADKLYEELPSHKLDNEVVVVLEKEEVVELVKEKPMKGEESASESVHNEDLQKFGLVLKEEPVEVEEEEPLGEAADNMELQKFEQVFIIQEPEKDTSGFNDCLILEHSTLNEMEVEQLDREEEPEEEEMPHFRW